LRGRLFGDNYHGHHTGALHLNRADGSDRLFGRLFVCLLQQFREQIRALDVVWCTDLAAAIIRIAAVILDKPQEMMKEVCRAPVTLLASTRMAVKICILAIVRAFGMVGFRFDRLASFARYCIPHVFVETVVFRKGCDDPILLWKLSAL